MEFVSAVMWFRYTGCAAKSVYAFAVFETEPVLKKIRCLCATRYLDYFVFRVICVTPWYGEMVRYWMVVIFGCLSALADTGSSWPQRLPYGNGNWQVSTN